MSGISTFQNIYFYSREVINNEVPQNEKKNTDDDDDQNYNQNDTHDECQDNNNNNKITITIRILLINSIHIRMQCSCAVPSLIGLVHGATELRVFTVVVFRAASIGGHACVGSVGGLAWFPGV